MGFLSSASDSFNIFVLKIGEKDLPEMINFVLRMTGSPKLVYVGHSMGSTAMFTMLNIHPHIADRIHAAHLLAPGKYDINSIRYYCRLYGD